MNYRKFLIIVFLSNCLNVFSQSFDFPKIMYVNATDGLRKRAEPSINSTVIGSLLYGERVVIKEKSGAKITIGGITDYWYMISCNYYDKSNSKYYDSAWIFGGYLSDSMPLDVPVILGLWENEDNDKHLYYFSPNYIYKEGAKESEWFKNGKWKINENTLILVTEHGAYEKLDNPKTEEVTLSIINMNYVILKFPDGKVVKLIRSNDVYIQYDFIF